MRTVWLGGFTAVAGVCLLAAPTVAVAQDEASDTGSSEFDGLKKCRAIAEDSARLACFDRAVGVVIAAEESGELRVVDKEAARKTRRRLFGFSLPDLGLFGGGDDDDEKEELESLETTIASVRRVTRREYVFTTEEGAVWRIASLPSRIRPPQAGQPVEFKRASLGSFFIRLNGQLGVKGRRIG